MQGWPVNEPDIIVSTPAALLNNIDPKNFRRMDFIRSVKIFGMSVFSIQNHISTIA